MANFTAQSLKSRILDVLAAFLGTYEYSNGLTITAFKTEGLGVELDVNNKPLAKPMRVQGLECVLTYASNDIYEGGIGGGWSIESESEIILKQHNPAETTIAASAALRQSISEFIKSGTYPRIPRNSALGNLETQSYTLYQFTV